MKKRKFKKGFTLVELLIVIAISGILMAIAAPKYSGMVDKANGVQEQAYAREVINHIDIYNAENSGSTIDDSTAISSIDSSEIASDSDFKSALENLKSIKGKTFEDKTVKDIRDLANKKGGKP